MIRWTPDGQPPRRLDPPGPGLVLDRDGCMTVEEDHLTEAERLVPLPGAQQAVARAAESGYRVAVVTNQSVVGRGMVTADGMVAMHARLVVLFPAIEVVYHCPHRPDEGCPCRKPAPAMPVAAINDLGLDPPRTVLVGDKLTDVQAGWAAEVSALMVRTGHGSDEAADAEAAGARLVADLPAAVELLLG